LISLTSQFIKILKIFTICLWTLFESYKFRNFIRAMNFISIVQFDPVRISFIPNGYNNTFLPDNWICRNLTLDFISYLIAKFFRNTIFESIDKVFSINIFSYKAKMSLSFLKIFPSIFDEITGEQHMNSLEDIWSIRSNHIYYTFISK